MSKGKFVALSLIVATLLSWQVASVDIAASGVISACSSTAIAAPGCYVICPQGDGDRLGVTGSTIYVVAKDATGFPLAGIPAADFWLIGCLDQLVLCGGGGSINADSASNANGRTTISGDLAASGCDLDGVAVVIQGVIVAEKTTCLAPLCLAIIAKSPDMTGDGGPIDGLVDIIDLAEFAANYTSPPKPLFDCADFNCDGLVDIIDFSIFAQHYLHAC
jgi:hypothetical protein